MCLCCFVLGEKSFLIVLYRFVVCFVRARAGCSFLVNFCLWEIFLWFWSGVGGLFPPMHSRRCGSVIYFFNCRVVWGASIFASHVGLFWVCMCVRMCLWATRKKEVVFCGRRRVVFISNTVTKLDGQLYSWYNIVLCKRSFFPKLDFVSIGKPLPN